MKKNNTLLLLNIETAMNFHHPDRFSIFIIHNTQKAEKCALMVSISYKMNNMVR